MNVVAKFTRADGVLMTEAADTISRLTADNEALRAMSDAHREHAQSAVENCASLNRLLSIAEARADALAQEVERKDAALGLYANEVNWKLGGPCDPNSPNFAGISFARAALANEEAGR